MKSCHDCIKDEKQKNTDLLCVRCMDQGISTCYYSSNMSAGYASRLSSYPNKGVCGLPEKYDTPRTYQNKIRRLIEYVQRSNYTVILTGAGISTSAGIPDFRGPSGIWTVEEQQQQQQQQEKKSTQKKRKRNTRNSANTNTSSAAEAATTTTPVVMNFTDAKPTLTHRIITKLVQGDTYGKSDEHRDPIVTDIATTTKMNPTTTTTTTTAPSTIQFVITQNVDGLHRRSGLSRKYHAVLHGCTFTEICHTCHTEYFRNYDVGTVGFQHTGRYCPQCRDCNNNDNSKEDINKDDHSSNTDSMNMELGKLYDTVLDWEDALPEYDYERSMEHCTRADLVICLGTSLRIGPVNELPLLAKQFIIVNLQVTPYDGQAALVIRQRTDIVLADLYQGLMGHDFLQWESNVASSTLLPMIEYIWRIPVPSRKEKEGNGDDYDDNNE
jgi:mono-ADP-ribosyltransferase sirtuin 6